MMARDEMVTMIDEETMTIVADGLMDVAIEVMMTKVADLLMAMNGEIMATAADRKDMMAAEER